MNTPPTLDTFIDQLLDEKHAGVAMPPQARNQMKRDLMERLNKMIMLKMLEQLSPQQVEEFQQMAQGSATNEELQAYLNSHITNQDVFLAQVLGEFRELYLGPPPS